MTARMRLWLILTLPLAAGGCASMRVRPWDRDLLADPAMQFNPNPMEQAADGSRSMRRPVSCSATRTPATRSRMGCSTSPQACCAASGHSTGATACLPKSRSANSFALSDGPVSSARSGDASRYVIRNGKRLGPGPPPAA